jgi:hypothetical protein
MDKTDFIRIRLDRRIDAALESATGIHGPKRTEARVYYAIRRYLANLGASYSTSIFDLPLTLTAKGLRVLSPRPRTPIRKRRHR